MIVTLISNKQIESITLPKKVEGQYWLSKLIGIEGKNEQWVLKSNKNVKILDEEESEINTIILEELNIYNLKLTNNQERLILFTEPVTDDRQTYQKLQIKQNAEITIGRNINNEIVYLNQFVSGRHAKLTFLNSMCTITDENSTNGTFVNGKRINDKEKLKVGDVIYIMGLKIIIGNKFIAYNNPDNQVEIHSTDFKDFVIQKKETSANDEEDDEIIQKEYFYRSPRFKRDIKKFELTIDPPPQNQVGEETPLILVLGPSITMGMASLSTAIFSINNAISTGSISSAMPSIITSISMLLGTLMWPMISKKFEKKRKKLKEAKRQEKYKAYLENIEKQIAEEKDRQKEIILENNITIEECIKRIEQKDRKLWERGIGQNDFLSLRIGIGSVPLNAEITYQKRKFKVESDNLEEDLYTLGEEQKLIHNVPLTISLFDNYISGVIGNRKDEIQFAKGLIMQIATLYSYDEVKMVFLYDEDEEKDFEFVKWLPHVWNKEKSFRFICTNKNELKDVSSVIENEISYRKELQKEDVSEELPYYVIFAMSRELSLRAEMIKQMCKSKNNLNISVITFFDELKNLPKECSKVIELNSKNSKIYDKNDITGEFSAFEPDILIEKDLTNLSTKLANIELDLLGGAYKLPKLITFLELFGVGKVEYLNSLTRWKENDPTKTLETAIGIDTLGDPFKLDLHERFHGPHGLIAGMTGSGKSEFIMTFILSLAVNYHPNEVAFILIDYKGGGMAKAFENLPHTAGIITNLDGAEVKRSLVSIQSELKRRQTIFTETSKKVGISNIDIYKYQKLYRDGAVEEPLPHLFIISDEFAELKSQKPEFMGQLISIARIGRSLGVHLILATQKPSGVVDDQIWSNTKFRVCLKVQEKADSQDMLKRPEAAELKETGRFYLQVGYNELFELGQSAWCGAPYYPSEKVEVQKDESVQVIDKVGRVIKEAKIDKKKIMLEKPRKQLDVITEYLKKLSEKENIKVQPLWLPPIPKDIYLDEIKSKYKVSIDKKEGLCPVIGEYDDPERQRQCELKLPISKEGNVVLFGASGSGKEMFLTTMIYSILQDYTSSEVNLYILDFDAETLKAFEQAPQVGDVVLSHETEKVNNLMKLLLGQLEKRKKLFADYGGNIYSYNSMSQNKEPEILVIINNFSIFTEIYEEKEADVQYLSREGTKYGIYFVLTATNRTGIKTRLMQNIKQLITLQMNDKTDYTAILGKTEGIVPSSYKGRGLIKTDQIYEFQTAKISKEQNEFMFIKNFCKKLKEANSAEARKIPILPDKVDKNLIKPYISENMVNIPVGVETATLTMHKYPFEKSYINLILSADNEHNEFVDEISSIFVELSKIDTTIIDINKNMAKKGNYACNINDSNAIIDDVYNETVKRHNDLKDAEEKGISISPFKKKIIIINSLKDLMEKLDSTRREKLSLVLEKGRVELQMNIIIAENYKNLANYNFEKWYKDKVSANDGIWVGNRIKDQYYLKTTKEIPELRENITSEYAFAIEKGIPIKIKILSKETEE